MYFQTSRQKRALLAHTVRENTLGDPTRDSNVSQSYRGWGRVRVGTVEVTEEGWSDPDVKVFTCGSVSQTQISPSSLRLPRRLVGVTGVTLAVVRFHFDPNSAPYPLTTKKKKD